MSTFVTFPFELFTTIIFIMVALSLSVWDLT